MEIIFYNHIKKVNSLKLPTTGTPIECMLKDSCTILNPMIELKVIGTPKYNYAYIAEFDRYYYVSNWNYYMGTWSCNLSVDVLTSWRDSILNTNAFVEYSSSNYSLDYTDDRIVSTRQKEITVQEIPPTLSIFDRNGCYILSIISTDGNGYNGACAVYALTQHQLQSFAETITAQNFLDGVWESIKNSFNNPFEAIVSCRWIPFSVDSIDGVTKEIVVTYASTGVDGKLITNNVKGQSFSMNLPRVQTTPTFLDTEPFLSAALYLPFVGTVPLDVDAYYKSDTFSCSMYCDIVTGDIIYSVGSSYDAFTSTYSGNCATQIPLSNNMVDSLGMIASTTGVIGGIVSTVVGIATKSKKLITKGMGAIGLGAVGTIKSAEVHTQMNGAISSRIGAQLSLTFRIVIMRSKVLEAISSARISTIGLPCYKTLLLSTLTGYCQCSGVSVSADAFDEELDKINELLEGGVYIE